MKDPPKFCGEELVSDVPLNRIGLRRLPYIRQMWAEEVNRQLTEGRRPEGVDHRSLAAQREAAIQKGQAEKAADGDN